MNNGTYTIMNSCSTEVLTEIMEWEGCMTYTGASHQGVIKMFWFHIQGASMSSIVVILLVLSVHCKK